MCQSSTCGGSRSAFFAQLAAYDDGAGVGVTGGDRPIQVQATHVSADYFSMFGAPMILGRPFTDDEDSPNGGRVVVLSYGLWKNQFGGNAHIVGTTIQLDGQSHQVVGVVGKRFVTEMPTDLCSRFSLISIHRTNPITSMSRHG
jgi:putative ABC transport system permease protein